MKAHMIFISNQGHTEEMAETLMEAMKEKGIDVTLFSEQPASEEFLDADLLFFGSPACGTEEVDDELIQPTIDEISSFEGKKVFLFGSYGWGDGRYMELWVDDMVQRGATLFADPIVCLEEPDEETLQKLRAVIANL